MLPGATVTVRGGRLPAEGQRVSSTPSGNDRVPLLPPGTYSVKNISNVEGATFGTPTDYFPGRKVQLGMRWMFGR